MTMGDVKVERLLNDPLQRVLKINPSTFLPGHILLPKQEGGTLSLATDRSHLSAWCT